MTDRQGALGVLANSDAPERETALAAFYERYKGDAAGDRQMVHRAGAVDAATTRCRRCSTCSATRISALTNPNRLRSLIGAFGANQRALHSRSGRGYRFLADAILAVDKLNPQNAARSWSRRSAAGVASARRAGAMMRAELERIVRRRPASPRTCSSRPRKSLG